MMIDGESYPPLPEGGPWKNSRQGAAFDEKCKLFNMSGIKEGLQFQKD